MPPPPNLADNELNCNTQNQEKIKETEDEEQTKKKRKALEYKQKREAETGEDQRECCNQALAKASPVEGNLEEHVAAIIPSFVGKQKQVLINHT